MIKVRTMLTCIKEFEKYKIGKQYEVFEILEEEYSNGGIYVDTGSGRGGWGFKPSQIGEYFSE